MMKMKMKKAELVFIPMTGVGHLVSALQVAKRLVDLDSNLSVTVLLIKRPTTNPTIIAKFDSIIANTISTRLKIIHVPQLEFDKDGPAGKSTVAFIQSQRPSIKDAVNNIVRESSSVPDSPRLAGFVLDMFLTYSLNDLANEFGVPTYVFFTCGAAFLGFEFYMQALHDDQNVNITELKDSDIKFNIPSYVNPVSSKFFPTVILKPESSNVLVDMARAFRRVKGIMVNTFSELESHAVDFLCQGQQLPPVYPVGPILNLESSGDDNQKCGDIMEWLDEQPPSSVVFLCFGSMGSLGEDQVIEIAYALEHSGHRFLWSLRKPPESNKGAMPVGPTEYENVADVLPEGFLDRTVGIGKIIGWAPQVAILGHQAIGGFVSHCGWNSTLESIWFGVPMATWPLYAEQQLNAFVIVKELGIGVEIKMDYRKEVLKDGEEIEIVSAEKIEAGIRCLMEQDSNVRKRVKELSEKSRKVLMDGGSSHSTLCRFINDVMDNMS